MDLGKITFCCSDTDCEVAGKTACIVFDFCQLLVAFKNHCQMQISLKAFAIDQEEIDHLTTHYIRFSKDCSQMKVDRRISNVRTADGDVFVNIFRKL